MPLLEVRDLVSGYGGAEILSGVSVDVDDDEVVCVIGPNGAGKSTLMRTVFGLIDAREGEVRLGGRDVTDVDPEERVRMGMSYVPQTENVFADLTVRENLEMGAYVLDGVPEDRIRDVYDLFPVLGERSGGRAGSMSGGQQQMLAIGRALMVDPDLLIIDEPSAGLAPELADEVFDRIESINEAGTSVLMVEQNARKALRRSDRGYVLDGGENRFEGSGEELLGNGEVRELYLGG